jgi:hypothetical protein
MTTLLNPTGRKDLISRLRRVLATAQLDCQCRATLDGALARFSALESHRHLRGALGEARRQREWIAAQLAFLAELDEITAQETDGSVYEEVAALFDEIAAAAALAAQAIRDTAATAQAPAAGQA